jgi:hypothetical protein
MGAKATAFRLEFMSQFVKIVDLAIEGQYVAITSVHHRLMAARAEINDAEPIVTDGQTNGRVNKFSYIVWPAMGHCGHHPIKRRLIQSSLRIYQPAAYRTHSVKLPFEARRSTPLGGRVNLSSIFHPAMSRDPVSFEPVWHCEGRHDVRHGGIRFPQSKRYRHLIHR